MSNSILTNASAMAALQTLRSINDQLDTTQSHISSGLRVGQASDNAAYWSIATTMRSDNKSLSAVSDALGLGSSTVDTAYTGMNSVLDNLNNIKKDLVTAQQPGVDKSKIQADIDAQVKTIQSIAQSASFSGSNWLSIDSSNGGTLQSVVASLSRDSNNHLALGTISVDTTKTALFDASATSTGLLEDVGTAGSATGAFSYTQGSMANGDSFDIGVTVDGNAQTINVKVTDAATFSLADLVAGLNAGLSGAFASDDGSGNLVISSNSLGSTSTVSIDSVTANQVDTTTPATLGFTTAAGTAGTDTGGFGIAGIDVSNASLGTLAQYMQGVDKMISNVTGAASDLGAKKSQISSQTEFVKTLMDTIDKGVGTLVDADMNKESTRLKALQTQQQLGIQALSIANSNSQSILSLFR